MGHASGPQYVADIRLRCNYICTKCTYIETYRIQSSAGVWRLLRSQGARGGVDSSVTAPLKLLVSSTNRVVAELIGVSLAGTDQATTVELDPVGRGLRSS